MEKLPQIFIFPHPVNEWAARCVAGMVMALTLSALFTGQWIIIAVLLYGFCARVATGPTLSPIGQIAIRLLVPLIGKNRPVAGPPKRFAQFVGLLFALTALILFFAVDSALPYRVVLAVLASFAFLESILGFCAGCFVFGYMMKWKLVPESVCETCINFEAKS